MNANEILPAIPRQKVKNTTTGKIGEVIYTDQNFASSVFVKIPDGTFMGWHVSDCEPVPEEPRPFRVGDAVVMHHEGVTNYSRISSIIVGLDGTTMASFADQPGAAFDTKRIRLASPQESKDYFN